MTGRRRDVATQASTGLGPLPTGAAGDESGERPVVAWIEPSTLGPRLVAPGRRPTVVDVRPASAYNGWRHADEVRGGHIPGAASLPAAWLSSANAPVLRRLLSSKGVVANRDVIVCGTDDREARAAADALTGLGVSRVAILTGGFTAWAADPDRPVDRLPCFERLVSVGWLRALLAGERPEAAPNERFLLFHVNFGGPAEYAEGHIPGAAHLDTLWLEDPADWNRRPADALAASLPALGITRDTTVIVYGRDSVGLMSEKRPGRRAGQLAATRALLILRYAGVEDVRLLDGGFDRWVRAGHPIEIGARPPSPVATFGAPVPGRPDVLVDVDEAKRVLADPEGSVLVSVRTAQEHAGRTSGYRNIIPAGRIPGDVRVACGSNTHHLEHYRNPDNTMRAYPEIAALWAKAGVTPDKRVAFYCGTGWRASEAWFAADLQGWQRIAVYDGGWFEWSKDPANPIEIGAPPPRSPGTRKP